MLERNLQISRPSTRFNTKLHFRLFLDIPISSPDQTHLTHSSTPTSPLYKSLHLPSHIPTMSNTTPFRLAERKYRKEPAPPLSTHFHPHPHHSNIYISPSFPHVALLKSHLPLHTQKALMLECISGLAPSLGYLQKNNTNLQALYYPLPQAPTLRLDDTTLYPGRHIAQTEGLPNRMNHKSKEHTTKPATALAILAKLRWATIGYNYDWNTLLYDLSPATTSPVPESIQTIARDVVGLLSPTYPRSKAEAETLESDIGSPEAICSRTGRKLPLPELYASQREEFEKHRRTNPTNSYNPDAGIINFYPPSSTLTGHVDRSEINLYAPLVSISLGRECTFLLGGFGVEDEEIAALGLESGDVLVMWGSARRRVHGVPRIGTEGGVVVDGKGVSEELKGYLEGIRININVRQMGF